MEPSLPKVAYHYPLAKTAAETRWETERTEKATISFDFESLPLDEAKTKLVWLLDEYQRGARIVEQRIGDEQSIASQCFVCKRKHAKPSAIYTLTDKETRLQFNIFLCSPTCNERYQRKRQGGLAK